MGLESKEYSYNLTASNKTQKNPAIRDSLAILNYFKFKTKVFF